MFAVNARPILLRTRKPWHLNLNHKKVNVLPMNPMYVALRHKQNSMFGGIGNMLRFTSNIMFGKYLFLTNTLGSGILMVIGDIVVQEYDIRTDNSKAIASNNVHYDIERIGRMFVAGALMGPLHHYVYNWMEKTWPVPNVKNTIQKIIIDEIIMSPICIVLFFYSVCFLEKKSIKETHDELKAKFLVMYLVDWLLWPPVQYVNFRYVDVKYRVTIVNMFTAFYNVFMSYMKHNYDWDI